MGLKRLSVRLMRLKENVLSDREDDLLRGLHQGRVVIIILC